MKNLKTMKVDEIKAVAREMGIKGWWDMKKAQLIEAIENHQQTEPLVVDGPIEETVESVSESPETNETKEDVVTFVVEENVSEAKMRLTEQIKNV